MELIIDRLTKQYGTKIAVDRLSLTLTPGVYGLLGANGAGKTTLMRMLCGVQSPTSGSITLRMEATRLQTPPAFTKASQTGAQTSRENKLMRSLDVTDESYREVLGYLPQDFGYYPEFTAMDFLLYMGCLKGLSKQLSRAKASELLELVSLTDVARKKIRTFSGGMKQRLGIAQAMINNPALLVLDEPTAGLDPKERVRFRNLISRLGSGRIVLLSTHIVSDVEHIAKQILMMKDGQLIHSGNLNEILECIRSRIYECKVSPREAEALASQYTIINIREEEDGTFLRLAADRPPCQGAVNVPASLEDLYLYYFGDNRKDET